ncbi:cactin-like [Mesocricetus auratus]|uniref:Splicing factor Cactin n=1 Tax=Mesocricetus auratus TaxID=10036 RepID=A0ABM2WB98_MESAU|nr:cactin-like [Mesocricetus auratus]
MGGDIHWCSQPSGPRGQRQRSQSQSHGQSEQKCLDRKGRREGWRLSQRHRSDSEGDPQTQRCGRRSRSARPRRLHSRDLSSQSDSGEEPARGSWALHGHSRSPGSTASNSDSPRRSRSPGAAALAPSQQQTLKERLWLRVKRRRQEELLKALETPEEKRARRLAKKQAKEHKRQKKMGWSEDSIGYTNADNPFGDSNLLGTFIWIKALEKKGISHLEEKELKERVKRVQENNRLELQKVKQLRLEREREKALQEQELEQLQRDKEAEHFKTWEEQEDSFHLKQAKLRSKIRIRDGRAKPIDVLANYISAEDDDLAVEMHEPYSFLNGLTVADMEDLLEDIRVYTELEQGKNTDFWRDMTIITEAEIAKLLKLEASGKGPGERPREGINAAVSPDVQSVFKGKTSNQLQVIFQGIEGKIRAGGPNLDMGYWESLLQLLRAHMARARLRERHQDVLRQKLFRLKQEQGVDSEPTATPNPGPSTDPAEAEGPPAAGKAADADGEAVPMEENLIQQSLADSDDYDAGPYSPQLLRAHELPLDAHVLEPHEDLQRLQLSRQRLRATGDGSDSDGALDVFLRRASEGMGQDEAPFSVEMPLRGCAYLWADKYRPRKPRFFNRVHTGFEWNKYNQTHYDVDNPPPKMVQGYKFNIFYPDLICKRVTPEYFLEDCADNRDFAILRFHAGPPYEDIAFKIVSSEWDCSHRRGFRCQFANGIFQLWFHFKRYRYRR